MVPPGEPARPRGSITSQSDMFPSRNCAVVAESAESGSLGAE